MSNNPRFTGERPHWGDEFDYDEARHLAAYHFAATRVAGRKVMDAGCGEGFATQTLTETARSVTGVDYSQDAIEFCTSHWTDPKLTFRRENLTGPPPVGDVYDVVLNFQVVEHIDDAVQFLRGLRSRLAEGGELVLTTPNRLRTFSENPYHVREYTAAELEELLQQVFSEVEVLGIRGNAKVEAFDAARERGVKRIMRLDPFGLRHRLPEAWVKALFARFSVLVRRSAKQQAGAEGIRPTDFDVVSDDRDRAQDLLAICRA
ncbi:MAG: SAM-dependent methyltransferase [Hyphomicrobiaceae bacterium]|jgi:SAM-dependent methyltransferase